MPPDPPRLMDLTAPCSYSWLFFFNQLPTSNFIETPEHHWKTLKSPQHWCKYQQTASHLWSCRIFQVQIAALVCTDENKINFHKKLCSTCIKTATQWYFSPQQIYIQLSRIILLPGLIMIKLNIHIAFSGKKLINH